MYLLFGCFPIDHIFNSEKEKYKKFKDQFEIIFPLQSVF